LKAAGVLAPYVPAAAADIPAEFKDPDGWWTGFAARARVILYRTDQVAPGQAPRTLADLAQPRFRGQVALARPLFGTTFTHAAALFATMGDEPAQSLLLALKQNGAVWVAGNAMARDLVVRGEKAVCLTDSDDAHGALLKGAPVAMVYPDQEAAGALVIPNSAALIRGGPNPENARKLIEFLVSAEVEGLLAQSESAQIPVRPGVRAQSDQFRLDRIKVLRVDWAAVARKFPAVKAFTEAQLLGN
jgi:iron(III) transport system substrate-binding protein